MSVVNQQADDDDGPDQVLQRQGKITFANELLSELNDEEDQGIGSKDCGCLVNGDVEGAIKDGQPLLQDWAMLWEVRALVRRVGLHL